LVALLTTLAVSTLVPSADAQPKRGPRAVADTAPPETTISSGPSGTIAVDTTGFAFSSSEVGSSFECQLDSAAYAACSSPKTSSALTDGSHSLSVRATDAADNTDATPATRSFTVDTTTPAPPSGGMIPSTWQRFASFESILTGDTDGWRADSPFVVTRTNEVGGTDGSYASKIVTNGGDSGCSCPRMKFEDGFSYGPGDEVWMRGAWLVPDPSKLAWSRLMNLGHFEASGDPDNWYLALLVTQPGQMEVRARQYQSDAGQSILMAQHPVPQGRWFTVDLHFKLSPTDGQALTEVYIDGRLVTSTTERNMFSERPLHFYNAGLSYFWPGNGNTTVYFDGAGLAS
ncbi:MAG: heparin lyase I family protein, partial [bacterium]